MTLDPNPFASAGFPLLLQILGKLLLGLVLGGIIGWEREAHGRPAGIRTHMLVVLGVVLISECSRYFGGSEPSRIAAQIVTGIGFLGAGTILRQGTEVKGLTTAASVWGAAAIGMAVSVGGVFYLVAIFATFLVLGTLTVVDRIDAMVNPDGHPRELVVTLATRADVIPLIENLTKEKLDITLVKVLEQGPPTQLAIRVARAKQGVLPVAVQAPGVIEARWG